MEQTRVSLPKIAPELYKTMAELDHRASAYAISAGFNEGFTHLLRIRASQINKCAYCLRMHTRGIGGNR
jgi:alkylhydroperoxidase family enzyme